MYFIILFISHTEFYFQVCVCGVVQFQKIMVHEYSKGLPWPTFAVINFVNEHLHRCLILLLDLYISSYIFRQCERQTLIGKSFTRKYKRVFWKCNTYMYIYNSYTKILEVNLFAFAYRLFRRDFSPLDGTYCNMSRRVGRNLDETVCRQMQTN